jgi:hypothetical protein
MRTGSMHVPFSPSRSRGLLCDDLPYVLRSLDQPAGAFVSLARAPNNKLIKLRDEVTARKHSYQGMKTIAGFVRSIVIFFSPSLATCVKQVRPS